MSATTAELRHKALDLLARREHSRAELTGKLCARGYPDEDVAALVARLVEEGLVSDTRFSSAFVRSRTARGYGPLRIGYELRRRGVSDEVAAAALAPLDALWPLQAHRARVKRFGVATPVVARERARQMRFLERRGFDHGQVRAALVAAADELETGTPDAGWLE